MAKRLMPTNEAIGQAAKRALTAHGYITSAGNCGVFVRQVCQRNGVPLSIFPNGLASARAQFEYFQKRGFEVPQGQALQVGDLLYKVRPADGKYGHVGMYIGHFEVAENSSAHVAGKDREARGIRGTAAFPQARIIRLPWGRSV